MKAAVSLAVTALFSLTLFSAAHAVDQFTPAVYVGASHTLVCTVINLTTTTRTVTTCVRDSGGVVVDSCFTLDLLPFIPSVTVAAGPDDFVYCQFSMKFSGNLVRAGATIQPALGDTDRLAIGAH